MIKNWPNTGKSQEIDGDGDGKGDGDGYGDRLTDSDHRTVEDGIELAWMNTAIKNRERSR